jgi:hypothetical protein
MSRSALPPLAIGAVVSNEFQDSWELTLRQAGLRLPPHACFDAAVAAMHISAVPSLTSPGLGETGDVGFRRLMPAERASCDYWRRGGRCLYRVRLCKATFGQAGYAI